MILTAEEVSKYTQLLDTLPQGSADSKKVIQLLRHHAKALKSDRFLAFVKAMWPSFIAGRHHQIMADAFERVANGKTFDVYKFSINK